MVELRNIEFEGKYPEDIDLYLKDNIWRARFSPHA
jgi:hypothetical protein